MTLGAPAARIHPQEARAQSAIVRLRAGLDAQERAMNTLDSAFMAGGDLGEQIDDAAPDMRRDRA